MKIVINKTILFLFLLLTFLQISCNKNIENKKTQTKNVILLIGDGMGIAHVYAALTANKGHLNIERCTNTGFSITYSASHYITDSGAGATAISTGSKTKNKYIAVDVDGKPLKTILEIAKNNGLSTGLVATSSITHATPAAFIAHDTSRYNQYEIARDFLDTDIDVFIGGGKKYFYSENKDSSLVEKLKEKNYHISYNLEDILNGSYSKLAGFLAEEHLPAANAGRKDMLEKATVAVINILKNNAKGFFLMVEGSQIDWASHNNDKDYLIAEMLDFDRTIGKVLDFAEQDKNTLVIIVGDHETGGVSITGGAIETGYVDLNFSTNGHSSVMVPIYAYGPGAEKVTGIMQNTNLFQIMMNAYGF